MVRKHFLDSIYSISSGDEAHALYSQWAQSYDEEVTQNGYASPLRTAKALKITGADLKRPLLDLGCGTGISGIFLDKIGFDHIDGSDFTPEMLKRAKEKGIYENLYQADLNDPFDFVERTYQTITAIGVFSPAHAEPEVIFAIFDQLPIGGYFAFTLNDHALDDKKYLENVQKLILAQKARLRWQDYGEHLPRIKLNSMVVVLEKL